MSGSDPLLNQYRAKITMAVKMNISEMNGKSLRDWSLAKRAFQLGPHQNTSSASDLVDLVLDDIQDALEYLDYQALSRHQSPSCSTGIEVLDTDVMARDMVLKAANKLKESMSEFDLEGESSTCQVSSETSNDSSLSHSNTDLRTLCVRSTEAVRTILQTTKTELDSHSDESFNPSQRARNLLARLAAGVESIDDLEIDVMLQGRSEVMEPGTMSQHPVILSSAFYCSLLIQCSLPPSNMVQETVFLSHPVISQNVTAEMKKQHSSDIQTNRQLTEFFAGAKRKVTQVIQDAALSMGVLMSHVTPRNIAEAATHVLESLFSGLEQSN
ncbi:uncharacterized protein LOC109616357 [Esox lucius]|uniref:uncharacterized protein LOC109616357 n=1 Tax=Esox lucius TaxID=8010 RepID=UPI0014772800|nr:uncharacterized protein LOC109616357 [Esox lucius]XP_019906704.2 uncharacterized protein LOC109616357 [Esox lucius]XP_019906705.2 uncharacterized protein LOC109616357 [Esox lucius]